jgi:hypothetical protein
MAKAFGCNIVNSLEDEAPPRFEAAKYRWG